MSMHFSVLYCTRQKVINVFAMLLRTELNDVEVKLSTTLDNIVTNAIKAQPYRSMLLTTVSNARRSTLLNIVILRANGKRP